MTLTRAQARPPIRSSSVSSNLDTSDDQRIDPFVSISHAIYKARIRATSRSLRRRPPPRSQRALWLSLLILLSIIVTVFFTMYNSPLVPKMFPTFSSTTAEKQLPALFALVTDLDRAACRVTNALQNTSCEQATTWISYYTRGIMPSLSRHARITVVDSFPLQARLSYQHRGMELSELQYLNSKLLAPDDRTGILYQIVSPKSNLPKNAAHLANAIPSRTPPSLLRRVVLYDGEGSDRRSFFKAEWMTVKDGLLYIGGHGRPLTAPGNGTQVQSNNPLWVKTVDSSFRVNSVNWTLKYDVIARAAGVSFPGYLMHEAVLWSGVRREWLFFPRRRSKEPFDAVINERKGWNYVIVASENFDSVRLVEIPGLADSSGLRGFSSAKFIPASHETLVAALRTIEIDAGNNGQSSRYTETFISVFSIASGEMIVEEQSLGAKKYEGLVFL